MILLLSIFIIPLLCQYDTVINCSQGQFIQLSQNYYPAYKVLKNDSQLTLQGNLQLIELILQKEIIANDSLKFIQNLFYRDQILQVYKDNKTLYYFYYYDANLEIENNKLQKLNFNLTKIIHLELEFCETFIKLYPQSIFQLIICDFQENYYFYWFKDQQLNSTANNLKFVNVSTFPKNINCSSQIIQDQKQQTIYFAYLNCSEWSVYTLTQKEILSLNRSGNSESSFLKNISSDNNNLFLIFPHIIYKVIFFSTFEKIYENQQTEIFGIITSSQAQLARVIILKDNFPSHQVENQILIIYEKDEPKQQEILNNRLYLLFDDYIKCFETLDQIYQTKERIDNLFFPSSYFPYFFGFRDQAIKIFKKNVQSTFLNCDEQINTQAIIFKQSGLYNYNNSQISAQIIFHSENRNIEIKNLITKNQIFKTAIYDEHKAFTLNINYFEFYQFFSLRILPINNNYIGCHLVENYEITNCQINAQTLWVRYHKISDQNYVVYQTSSLQIQVLACSKGKQISLGRIEVISPTNIFANKNQYILISQNQKKLYIMDLKQFPNIQLKKLVVEDKIVYFYIYRSILTLILKTCLVQKHHSTSLTYVAYESFSRNDICNQNTKYFLNYILKFQNQTLILQNKQVKLTMNEQFGQILDVILIDSDPNRAIILVNQNNADLLYKVTFLENNFKINFQLPKYNFIYLNPIQYVENRIFFIVAAQKPINDALINVLLVYDMINESHNSLVEVIENVDFKGFYFINENNLFFIKNSTPHFQTVGEISLNCHLFHQLANYSQTLEFQLSLNSKIFRAENQYHKLQISILNHNPKLSLRKELNQIIPLNEEVAFDPRMFVVGPIQTIQSTVLDIQYPLSKQSSFQCENLVLNYCFDEIKNNVFIDEIEISQYPLPKNLNNFKAENILVLSQFFIFYQKQSDAYILQIFNKNFTLQYELMVSDQFSIKKTQIFNGFMFIFGLSTTKIYELTNELTFVQEIDQKLMGCQIQPVQNNPHVYLIYFDFDCSYFWYLDINERNLLFIQIFNSDDPLITSQYFHFINANQFGIFLSKVLDGYLIGKVLILKHVEKCYVQKIKIDLNQKILTFFDSSIPLRIWTNFKLQSKLISDYHLDQNLISEELFYYIDTSFNLSLFNISNESFNFFDPIYVMNIANFSLQIINQTFLILSSRLNNTRIIMKVGSYILKLKENQLDYHSITLNNEVSSIELSFLGQFSQKNSLNFSSLLIILTILFLFCVCIFKILKRRRISIQSNSKQKEGEIEL